MKVNLRHIGGNGQPFVAVTVRFLAWPDVRDCAQSAGCRVEEKRVGLLSKQFKMTGSMGQLERFCELGWKRDIPGFRDALKEIAT